MSVFGYILIISQKRKVINMEPKYIKVSQYAKIHNLNYKTALRQFHAGVLKGIKIK